MRGKLVNKEKKFFPSKAIIAEKGKNAITNPKAMKIACKALIFS
jgi:hypothetical protein